MIINTRTQKELDEETAAIDRASERILADPKLRRDFLAKLGFSPKITPEQEKEALERGSKRLRESRELQNELLEKLDMIIHPPHDYEEQKRELALLKEAADEILADPELCRQMLDELGLTDAKKERDPFQKRALETLADTVFPGEPSQGVRNTSCEWVDKSTKYFLDYADMGRWCLVPVGRRDEWENWLNGNELPDYIEEIEDPSQIEFYRA